MDHKGQKFWNVRLISCGSPKSATTYCLITKLIWCFHAQDDPKKGWGSEGWFPSTYAVPVQVCSITRSFALLVCFCPYGPVFEYKLSVSRRARTCVYLRQELALWRGRILRMPGPDPDGIVSLQCDMMWWSWPELDRLIECDSVSCSCLPC